jgi:uncharacterized membrane protein YeaQ/YmgE (transglycosylase-associated protein family)
MLRNDAVGDVRDEARRREIMEALLPLITQLIAGAVGGNVASAALKQVAVNAVARTIAGAIGGIGGGMLLTLVGGETQMTGLIADGIGGLIGGGILSTIVGAVAARAR